MKDFTQYEKESSIVSQDDIILWEDGRWAFRYGLDEETLARKDYIIVRDGTDEWMKFLTVR